MFFTVNCTSAMVQSNSHMLHIIRMAFAYCGVFVHTGCMHSRCVCFFEAFRQQGQKAVADQLLLSFSAKTDGP